MQYVCASYFWDAQSCKLDTHDPLHCNYQIDQIYHRLARLNYHLSPPNTRVLMEIHIYVPDKKYAIANHRSEDCNIEVHGVKTKFKQESIDKRIINDAGDWIRECMYVCLHCLGVQ